MRFTVLGSGAVGGTLGAHLVRAGHEVLFCDVDREHVMALQETGLRLEGPVASFSVRVHAVLPVDLPADLGVVLLAVKSQHTRDALRPVRGRLGRTGYVVSLQNGLQAAAVGEVVGPERVVMGLVNFGADVLGPGRIRQGNIATVRVGEPDGRLSPRVRELAAALPWAEPTENILGYLWAKQAYGAMLFATAVSDLPIADALAEPAYRRLFTALAQEVLAQSPARPEAFDGFDPADVEGSLDRLVGLNRASAKTHSGIYRDLAVRRRPTEVGSLLALAGPLTTYTGLLIRAIERGERRCEQPNLDLLAAYEAADRLGRPLRAVVRLLPAPERAADGPLLGLSVAVKDMIDVAGQPRGNGNPACMAAPARPADAPVVARLRGAAADVFALTSLLEYAAGYPHPDLGEALNPVDPSRTAGGSSGGSAVLVAAGACPAALGTDTGGSVRIPAAYCGVVGLKPTWGLLPLAGVEPLAPSCDHVGVLGHDVATTRRVLGALTGSAPGAAVQGPLRIGVRAGQLAHPQLRPDVLLAVRAAITRLEAAGHLLVEVDDAPLAALQELLDPIVLHEAWRTHAGRYRQDATRYGPPTRELLAAASRVGSDTYARAMARRAELLPAAAALLDGLDALVGPSVPYVAPACSPQFGTPEGELESLFTGSYNLTGQPALSLPCGSGRAGLPVGLQLAGPVGGDDRLLAVAQVVERCLRDSSG